MSNAPDQVRKRAMKRLMQDFEEIKNSPVENVSAVPMENNMFEWHCNFLFDEIPYHLILFFPENYPYDSPSAEFVPQGFVFTGGATMKGKKGVKVCLSIFSDFAYMHKEWAKEKGMGWSPGYTVQTVLLNLVSFLFETSEGEWSKWSNSTWKTNAKLAKDYSCKDCGHIAKKPFPELAARKTSDLSTPSTAASVSKETEEKFQVVDYISKTKLNPQRSPKDRNSLYGYGLVVSGSKRRPSLTTPCEFLTGDSFYGMKKSMGKVHSMMKDELAVFLPMYLNETHGSAIKEEFETAMRALKTILPNCNNANVEEMIKKTIPNLMNATVVEFSKGTQHTSDNHLNGYFALHRLFLWAVKMFPSLQYDIDAGIQDFIKNESHRTKDHCPNLGEWLMLLSVSSKFSWKDAAEAFINENLKRQVMWYVKDDARLGFLTTEKAYRLDKTFAATAVSRKLIAFQVLFLDIAMPADWTREQVIARYDKTMGFPTEEMVQEMKEAVAKLHSMKAYSDWFKVLKLDSPLDDDLFRKLVSSVEYSINTDGYKWTSVRNQGGWEAVLKMYPRGTKDTDNYNHERKEWGRGNWDSQDGSRPPSGAGSRADNYEYCQLL